MAKSITTFKLYTDGSAFCDIGKYGAGIVSVRVGKTKNISRSYREKSIPLRGKHTSISTEMYAVAKGLNALEPESKVIVYTDQMDIFKKINKRQLSEWAQTIPQPVQKKACMEMFNAVARHLSVKAVYLSYGKSRYMRRAHDLAQDAALNMG